MSKNIKSEMNQKEAEPNGAVQLRKRAEKEVVQVPDDLEIFTPEETKRMLHELRVHQIELEIQNEELRRIQQELEASRARYFDLYDLAPVGYFTLDEKSVIVKANCTAANLLGMTKDALVKQPITRFIFPEDQDIYYKLRKHPFADDAALQECELRLLTKDNAPIWMRMMMSVSHDTDGAAVWRIVVSDITERKLKEKELIKVKNELEYHYSQLQTIFEHALEGIIICGLDGRLERWNPTALEIHGFSSEAECQLALPEFKTIFEFSDTKGRILPLAEWPLARVLRGEILSGVEIHIRRIQSDWKRIFSYHGSIIRDSNGQEFLAIIMVRDISRFKQAEEKVHDIALFPEQNPSPVMRIDDKGVLLYGNPASSEFQEQWGFKIGAGVPLEWNETAGQCLADRSTRSRETMVGDRIFVFAFIPVPPMGYVNVYAFDITERKKAERELKRAKNELEIRVKKRTADLQKTMETLEIERRRFNDVLEMLPAYVVLLAPDYQVKFANRFFTERFGSSNGKRCFEYLFGRAEACETCQTFTPIKTHAPHHWEWTGPDNRNYDVYDFPFTDMDGSPLIMEMGIDITDRKQAEAALIEANEMKLLGQLTSGVAHEVRNPLNGILAIMGALSTDLSKEQGYNERFEPYMHHLRSQVIRLTVLMEDLLALGRPLRKENICEISMVTLVENTLSTWLQTMQSSSPIVAFDKPESPENYVIQADNTRMTQMLVNLFENAYYQSPAGAEIVCTVHGNIDNTVVFSITDGGTGISDDIMPRIFEPFFTTRQGGTGLGLSIVRHIVESHGGTIIAFNNSNGSGATFEVRIPLANHVR